MKKVLFCLIAGAFATSASFAQGVPMLKGNSIKNSEVQKVKQQHQVSSSANRELLNSPYFIDYSVLDNLAQGATADYERFVWPLNSRYTTDDAGVIFNFAGVVFRNWNGYSDRNDPQGSFDETQSAPNRFLHIDSLFFIITHENNSGLEDSIILQISRQGATGGFSQSAPIVWQDTIKTTTSLSPAGNWLGANVIHVLAYAPNFDMPVNTFPGVSLKYLAPKEDTLGFVGTYTPNPAGPGAPNTIPLSTTYPYSYLRLPGQFDDGIFNPAGVYYLNDEGGPAIDPTSGDTTWFYIQGVECWVKATVGEVQGLEDVVSNGVRMGNIFPNPATETAGLYISLEKAAKVQVEIYDITGKLVSSQAKGNLMAGENKIIMNASELKAGSYIYRVLADGAPSVSKRFNVIR